ncbi:MAG: hypothetical protein FWG93_03310 [Oscillospiraceae bacterium]|nr:hypothetical protein [Oscillospiraceae bacterium]
MDGILKLALSAAATALLTGILASVTPRGGGRRVVEMCGGLLLLLVLLRPFGALGTGGGGVWDLEALRAGETEASILREGREWINQIIAERTGAYILNKSEAAGLAVQVHVVCSDDVSVPVPWAVTIRSARPEHARGALARMLEEELGIPPERQYFELIGGTAR